MTDQKNVQEFYDRFAAYEVKTGINLKHYCIFNEIIRSGLKRNHQVLEIGCGIGLITGLLHSYLKKGKIVSIDISPESIAIHNPEVLQIIDQALEANALLADAYHYQLKLVKYNAYTLFQQQPDYVFITFTKNHSLDYVAFRKW